MFIWVCENWNLVFFQLADVTSVIKYFNPSLFSHKVHRLSWQWIYSGYGCDSPSSCSFLVECSYPIPINFTINLLRKSFQVSHYLHFIHWFPAALWVFFLMSLSCISILRFKKGFDTEYHEMLEYKGSFTLVINLQFCKWESQESEKW